MLHCPAVQLQHLQRNDSWLPTEVKQLVLISDRELRIGAVTTQDATPTVNKVASKKQKGIKRRLEEMEGSGTTLNSPGWKASAMRGLPGLQVTRQKFPNASWYIQVVRYNDEVEFCPCYCDHDKS